MVEVNKKFDRNKLNDLILEFGRINKKAKGLTKILKNDLLDSDQPDLKLSTYVRLSRWCNTSSPYSGIHKRGGSQVAQDISMLLFGKIIKRED